MADNFIYAKGINGNRDCKLGRVITIENQIYIAYEKQGEILSQISFDDLVREVMEKAKTA